MSQRKIPLLFIPRAFQSLDETCLDYKELPNLIRKPQFPYLWLEFSPFVHYLKLTGPAAI